MIGSHGAKNSGLVGRSGYSASQSPPKDKLPGKLAHAREGPKYVPNAWSRNVRLRRRNKLKNVKWILCTSFRRTWR